MISHMRSISALPIDIEQLPIAEEITPSLFDHLEYNPNDPAVVHHHPLTGRILAATPARLISQITSPQFLNYELLSDFFLTFRCFMSPHDVLEYLLARMQWAFANVSDAGRIVRVRTFVALRHWILNYFPDDFLLDMPFRERFCKQINGLTRWLRRRPDRGGSDMNIIGELKKCWQRTCELYWPHPSSTDVTPDANIRPGGEQRSTHLGPSVLSLPLTIRPATRGGSSVFEVAQMHVPDQTKKTIDQSPRAKRSNARDFRDLPSPELMRMSIPTSPMSDQSLEVLSCSVPFLQHLRNVRRPSSHKDNKPTTRHDRSGSFSDALRDKRSPLSTHIDSVMMPSFTVSGGLVRGILLEPCPSMINLAAPASPTIEPAETRVPSPPVVAPLERLPPQSSSVKRIVGDMRRALSTRRANPGEMSIRTHRSTQSFSDLLTSTKLAGIAENRPPTRLHTASPLVPALPIPPPAPLPPPGPPRLDMLAARVEAAYHTAFEHIDESETESVDGLSPRQGHGRPENLEQALRISPSGQHTRKPSRMTTSSRSILIFDATGNPEPHPVPAGYNTLSPLSSVIASASLPEDAVQSMFLDDAKMSLRYPSTLTSNHGGGWPSSYTQFRDFLNVPGTLSGGTGSNGPHGTSKPNSTEIAARKSSFVHPGALDLSDINQQLRRRPGGDLKALDDPLKLRPYRPHSVSTFSSNSRSAATSALFTREQSRAHLSGQLLSSARISPKPPADGSVALLDLDAAPKHVRPSFEADALRLRDIPDEHSDGGIADALLKLEGKIPSPSRSTFSAKADEDSQGSITSPTEAQRSKLAHVESLSSSDDEDDRVQKAAVFQAQIQDRHDAALLQVRANASRSPAMERSPGGSSTDWSVSRMIPPPLDLGSNKSQDAPRRIILEGSDSASNGSSAEESMSPSIRAVHGSHMYTNAVPATYIPSGAAPGARGPASPDDEDDDDEDDDEIDSQSDISTEIADQPEPEGAMHSFYFDDTTEDRVRRYQEQIRAQAKKNAPPTPPSTTIPSAKTSADKVHERKVLQKRAPAKRMSDLKQLEISRPPDHLRDRQLKEAASAPKLRSPPPNKPLPQPPPAPQLRRMQTDPVTPQLTTHLPFVLAFESLVIAEQLTIIEKDALDEVDWKDLISLNWQQNPASVRNWVSYLKDSASNGIDVVIARFNLVVKWVVSEILLTSAPSERARAITKYIHIASHCHRLRNYASLYQIILALLSSDLIRLHQTWALVPVREKQTLAQLEALCQPMRNFNNLRVEMENATMDSGCIPFIGLYTHDLMFNAQKPARLEPVSSGKEHLVNFERYQTAASIVKSLLRMIEASSKYNFRPHPEALSRCLWIAALEDGEIIARSKALETT
jgi:hypothetical protein